MHKRPPAPERPVRCENPPLELVRAPLERVVSLIWTFC